MHLTPHSSQHHHCVLVVNEGDFWPAGLVWSRPWQFECWQGNAQTLVHLFPRWSVVLVPLLEHGSMGIEMIQQLRSDRTPLLGLPVIAVVPSGDWERGRAAMEAGAFDLLPWPCDPTMLHSRLDRAMAWGGQYRDQQQQLQQTWKWMRQGAFYQESTGLPNRLFLLARLNQILQNPRGDRAFGLLWIHISRYQEVKYSFGHGLAAQWLRVVGQRLCQLFGDRAIVAHGDEANFGVLYFQGDLEAVQEAAQHVHYVLLQPFVLDQLTLSNNHAHIGIAMGDLGYEAAEEYLHAADLAMEYGHGGGGYGTTVLFTPEMAAEVRQTLELEMDLQRAIAEGQLYLQYQAILELDRRRPVGVEALVRWHHPQKGPIPPSRFIPLAERSGLILTLGQWVLEKACGEIVQLLPYHSGEAPLVLHVNVSAIQLGDPLFLPTLDRLLAQLQPHRIQLKLELTESVLVSTHGNELAILQELRARGVPLSIDDFGTGYSSLSYLHNLPIQSIKVDRSFVQHIHESRKQWEIVCTMMTLARNLNLDVVAEGIEGDAQVQILQELGCRYGQGYLFTPALRLGDLIDFWRSH